MTNHLNDNDDGIIHVTVRDDTVKLYVMMEIINDELFVYHNSLTHF